MKSEISAPGNPKEKKSTAKFTQRAFLLLSHSRASKRPYTLHRKPITATRDGTVSVRAHSGNKLQRVELKGRIKEL